MNSYDYYFKEIDKREDYFIEAAAIHSTLESLSIGIIQYVRHELLKVEESRLKLYIQKVENDFSSAIESIPDRTDEITRFCKKNNFNINDILDPDPHSKTLSDNSYNFLFFGRIRETEVVSLTETERNTLDLITSHWKRINLVRTKKNIEKLFKTTGWKDNSNEKAKSFHEYFTTKDNQKFAQLIKEHYSDKIGKEFALLMSELINREEPILILSGSRQKFYRAMAIYFNLNKEPKQEINNFLTSEIEYKYPTHKFEIESCKKIVNRFLESL